MKTLPTCLVLVGFFASGCRSASDTTVDTTAASTRSPADDHGAEAEVHRAQEAYLAAINANDADDFLHRITDDAVYLPPNSSPVAGKPAVAEWVRGYLDAYRTRWVKTPHELIVRGDLAYEWYTYESLDTPRADGPAAGTPVVSGTGNGFAIWRRGPDGTWRVARDIWASDRPPGE